MDFQSYMASKVTPFYLNKGIHTFLGFGCVRYICLVQSDMAEKTLKKVEEELNCSICLDTYSDPKLLQCFHAYCRKCLVKLVVRDQQGQLILTCPICRHDTPVPANGVAGLQPAFQINHFLEIMEEHKKAAAEHKKAAADPPASAEKAERDSASLTSRDKVKVCCREHAGKEVELFCETCGEPVCVKCALKGGKHHSHDCEELDKAFERYKVEVTASLEPMEKQVTTITKALAQLDARCAEISDQRAAVEADVHTAFGKLQHILDTRKTELIGQLHHITQRKLKGLAVQRDQLETTLAQLSRCLGFMRESLKTGSQEEVLLMKSSVVKQVKELTTTFPPDMLKPSTEADAIFSALADVATACRNYGQVSAPGLPDPSKCHATGKGIEAAVVGEMSTAVLQAVNFKGQPCEEPIQSSECELVSELSGTRTRGSVERKGQSQYEINYQPTIKGRHQLLVKVEGQHIRGSPFTISAKSPVEKLGTPILTLHRVNGPWGVAINQRGEVIVAEYDGHCVSVFSPSGEKVRTFGTRGSGQGQFWYPCGVAVDDEWNILVADGVHHRIQKFTPEGQFLTAVGAKGKGPLQFDLPTDIVLNAANKKVYVTDCWNHRVQVLNSDLTFSSSFGKRGSGKGQFASPRGIACDSTGKVYVADYNNLCVQVFSAEGKFLKMFGRWGDGRGEQSGPIGVAIDSNDVVFVSEGGNSRVSVFTSEGVFVTLFGSRGEGPGQFKEPCGIAVDNSGVAYVCDLFITVFKYFSVLSYHVKPPPPFSVS